MKRALAACLAALAASCGSDSDRARSDWEVQNAARLAKEEGGLSEAELPPYPREEALIEFRVVGPDGFRFFVDRSSIAVNPRDGWVSYALVARSSSGASNVTFETMGCKGYEYQVHAIGRADGTWSRTSAQWRPIQPRAQRWLHVLYNDFFCPARVAPQSAKEAVTALEQGMHPSVRKVLEQR